MEQFLSQNSLYVVLIIVLIIWAGLAVFMWRLEKRVTELQAAAQAVNPAVIPAATSDTSVKSTSS